jgi:hypothetical protein
MSVWPGPPREASPFMRIRIRRSLFWFALCCAVLLAFPYALEGRSSDTETRPGAALVAALPRIPVAAVNPSAPTFAAAAREGVAELMGSGDHSIVGWRYGVGLWGGHIKANWWQSALAMLSLVRYGERTHTQSPAIQNLLLRIYARNIYKPLSTAKQDFANEFGDDTAWWGIAWLEASKWELYDRHDLKDATRFLAVAEWDARYINAMPKTCGGIPWALQRPPDAVTSAEFIALTAELTNYRNTPGVFYDAAKASTWLGEATSALAWLENERLINLQTGTVVDGLLPSCGRTGGAMTYTEGETAEALVELGNALHDRSYYAYAANFLRYALLPSNGLISNGVLQERCERVPGQCAHLGFHLDLPAFKGIFVTAVSDWSAATGNKAFRPFLTAQAVAVLNNTIRGAGDQPGECATPQTGQFAFSWTGRPQPPSLDVTLGGQESAIDALTAVLPQHT